MDTLIDAWLRIADRFPSWDLLVVGAVEDPAYFSELEKRVAESGLRQRWIVTGMLRGQEKLAAYSVGDIFVLPSRFENFGNAIAEAMASELPVITTTTTPWQELAERRAGWWIEPTASATEAALEQALGATDQHRAEMGQRAAAIVRSMGWKDAGEKMASVYRWVLGLEERPDFVL